MRTLALPPHDSQTFNFPWATGSGQEPQGGGFGDPIETEKRPFGTKAGRKDGASSRGATEDQSLGIELLWLLLLLDASLTCDKGGTVVHRDVFDELLVVVVVQICQLERGGQKMRARFWKVRKRGRGR